MRSKIWLIIKIIIIFMVIGLSIYFIKVISDLDVLPSKYFNILIVVYILANIMNILCLIPKKIVLNVIGLVLSIGIVILSILGIKHGTNISKFLNKSFNNNTVETTLYNVVVLKSSNFDKIEDLKDKSMGYTDFDPIKNKYIDKLNSIVKIELKPYNYLYSLYDDLINNQLDSFIINEGFLQLLEEKYEDISDNIKIIYSLEIEEKIETKDKNINMLKPINILISGVDSRTSDITYKNLSDVNMIVTIDPDNNKLLLTSIPRDCYVQLHNTTGVKDKLTHSGFYGINMTKETLEDFLNIKIDYSVKVSFKSLIKLVNLIGGIDIYSDYSLWTHSGDGGAVRTYVKKGMNHFNGAQALSYARERFAYKEGDNHRVQNQQQVLEAIIDKISKDKSLLMKYDEILNSLGELYRTDIPSNYIKLIVKDQLEDMKSWQIEKQQIDGTGIYSQTYSMPGMQLYVMIPDMNSVNECREKILSIQTVK